MRRKIERTEVKLGALIVLAALQLALVKILIPGSPLAQPALVLLSAVLLIGLAAVSPLTEAARPLPFLDQGMEKRNSADCLIMASDIAKYPQIELIIRMDKYLGGGVTATPYYEDIVGQIVSSARIAVRKHRFFLAGCVLAGIVQLGLLGQLLLR